MAGPYVCCPSVGAERRGKAALDRSQPLGPSHGDSTTIAEDHGPDGGGGALDVRGQPSDGTPDLRDGDEQRRGRRTALQAMAASALAVASLPVVAAGKHGKHKDHHKSRQRRRDDKSGKAGPTGPTGPAGPDGGGDG